MRHFTIDVPHVLGAIEAGTVEHRRILARNEDELERKVAGRKRLPL